MRVPTLLVALIALVAGCTTGDTPETEATVAEDAGTSAPTPAPDEPVVVSSPSGPSNASRPSNGTSGGSAGANATAPSEEAPAPEAAKARRHEENATGSFTLRVSAPCADPAPCSPGVQADPVRFAFKEPRPRAGTLVATWTPAAEPLAELSFNATTPEGVVVAQGAGPSPLTLTLDAGLLGEATELVVQAMPPGPGVRAKQEFSLHLVLEYS